MLETLLHVSRENTDSLMKSLFSITAMWT